MVHHGTMRLSELEARLADIGYVWVRREDSHAHFRHVGTGKRITVPIDNRPGAQVGVELLDNVLANAVRAEPCRPKKKPPKPPPPSECQKRRARRARRRAA